MDRERRSEYLPEYLPRALVQGLVRKMFVLLSVESKDELVFYSLTPAEAVLLLNLHPNPPLSEEGGLESLPEQPSGQPETEL